MRRYRETAAKRAASEVGAAGSDEVVLARLALRMACSLLLLLVLTAVTVLCARSVLALRLDAVNGDARGAGATRITTL